MSKIGGVILAAGKGTRMNSTTVNKVALPLAGKPMIVHALDLLESLNVDPVIIVVGFAKESVMSKVTKKVIYAEQLERLGTAHAVETALVQLPEGVENILVIQGDDSAFYEEEALRKMIDVHLSNNNGLTFLTVELSNPTGLGRVVRDEEGKVLKIVEEKDATDEIREVKEINAACYVFNVSFLRKYLPFVEKSPVTGEYYLVSLIEVAQKNKEKFEAIKGGLVSWRGVNTPEELLEAEKLYKKVNS